MCLCVSPRDHNLGRVPTVSRNAEPRESAKKVAHSEVVKKASNEDHGECSEIVMIGLEVAAANFS